MTEELREALAEYAHDAWSGWMKYMFEKMHAVNHDGENTSLVMPSWAAERWVRQMNTPFSDLPESEKESDRAEADKMLAIVHGKCMCGCDACKYCQQLLESSE